MGRFEEPEGTEGTRKHGLLDTTDRLTFELRDCGNMLEACTGLSQIGVADYIYGQAPCPAVDGQQKSK